MLSICKTLKIKTMATITRQQGPTLMTKEEFFAKVDRAKAQSERGEGRLFTSKEEMNVWLNNL